MSQYLRYLDVVASLMHPRYDIHCLRFDGTVSQQQRVQVREEFAKVDKPRPLLITAGAGSVGLNLTSGRIIILAEEWQNYSSELQAICRCWRQGAEGEVLVVKLHIENSAIDGEIARTRRSKVRTNESLMAPLVHKHDVVQDIVGLLY